MILSTLTLTAQVLAAINYLKIKCLLESAARFMAHKLRNTFGDKYEYIAAALGVCKWPSISLVLNVRLRTGGEASVLKEGSAWRLPLDKEEMQLVVKYLINDKLITFPSSLVDAIREGNEKLAKILIGLGIDINSPDSEGDTPLMVATTRGQTEIAKLLIDNGAEIDKQDNEGRTLLALAAKYGHDETAKLFIDNGANINQPDNNGMTPLAIAAASSHYEVAKLLIANGAEY